jgi:hypothetical protein
MSNLQQKYVHRTLLLSQLFKAKFEFKTLAEFVGTTLLPNCFQSRACTQVHVCVSFIG